METIYNLKIPTIPIYQFKSHYVVWKPCYRRSTDADIARFKSHYVVWKQNKEDKMTITINSLNRTM